MIKENIERATVVNTGVLIAIGQAEYAINRTVITEEQAANAQRVMGELTTIFEIQNSITSAIKEKTSELVDCII